MTRIGIKISTAARRIARTLNRKRGQGGFCIFDNDGTGGRWYSDRSYPTVREDQYMFDVFDRYISQAEVQHRLDGDDRLLCEELERRAR